MLYRTNNIPQNIPCIISEYDNIPSLPQNVVMDMNNVMELQHAPTILPKALQTSTKTLLSITYLFTNLGIELGHINRALSHALVSANKLDVYMPRGLHLESAHVGTRWSFENNF